MKKLFMFLIVIILTFPILAHSEENDDIDALTSNLLMYTDEFDGDTTYYSKFTHEDHNGSPLPSLKYNGINYYEPFEISLYHNSDGFKLIFRFKYKGNDWIFFELVRVKVDDEIFDLDLSYSKIHRKILDGGKVSEYISVYPGSDLLEIIRKSYQSKNLSIRFIGEGQFTYEAPEETLNAIEEIITIYDQLI